MTHSLQTRGNDNIVKTTSHFPGMVWYPLPKALLAVLDSHTPKPTSFTATSKDSHWRVAMPLEHGILVLVLVSFNLATEAASLTHLFLFTGLALI